MTFWVSGSAELCRACLGMVFLGFLPLWQMERSVFSMLLWGTGKSKAFQWGQHIMGNLDEHFKQEMCLNFRTGLKEHMVN